MKENSIGSVTPVKKEQNAADASSPYTIFIFRRILQSDT